MSHNISAVGGADIAAAGITDLTGLADTLAVCASGGYERLAGFTDAVSVAVLGTNSQPVLADPANPLTSPPVFSEHGGVDWSDTWYARGALLWKPTEGALDDAGL